MRIVVLGGYGNFGARICRALAQNSGIEVIAAGRNPDRGPQDILLDSRIQKAQLDFASADFPKALKRLSPEIVIHCAGPFQGQDYCVVSAAIAAGAHYIDLADSREFVVHFAEHNNAAARSAVCWSSRGEQRASAFFGGGRSSRRALRGCRDSDRHCSGGRARAGSRR
jgi:saccharopine dehydrogenase-like NADP-dependent oxidoreductase